MSPFHGTCLPPDTAQRLADQDPRAQEAVYRAYASAVYTLAMRILREPTLAEEVTQDTFVDVIVGADRLRSQDSLGGWIRAIAVNHCRMRLRSPWHRRRESLAADEEAALGEADPDRTIDMDRALERLSPKTRMVVFLHCVEGYTHDEIGRLFGKSASFSKSQFARACKELELARKAQPDGAPATAADSVNRRKRGQRLAKSSDESTHTAPAVGTV